VALPGCTDLLHDPAPAGPATLSLAYALDPEVTAQSLTSAFGQADGVLVRITRRSSGAVLEQLSAVTPGSGEIRVRLEVGMEAASELVDLFVEIRRGTDALFRGIALVELRSGGTVAAEVNLAPVPAGLALSAPSSPLAFLGATAQLQGQVLFATGDVIPGRAVQWESLDPGVATVTPQGVVTARGEGDARMVGRAGPELADTVVVQVRPEPASIRVQPESPTIPVGGSVQFTATVLDAGGSPMERAVTWSSSNPVVAPVSGEGLAVGQRAGSTTIRATLADLAGETTLRVEAVPPTVESLPADEVGAESARLQGQVNPRGSPTQVWFEWGLQADLSDARSTPARTLAGSGGTSAVAEDLSGLRPETVHYARIVAENDGGRATGATLSFTTLEFLPAPTEFEASQDGDVFMWWDYDVQTYVGVTFQVERFRQPAGPWILVETTEFTYARDPWENLDPETTYVYRVRACRPTHCSPFSNTVTLTTWSVGLESGVERNRTPTRWLTTAFHWP
jgi:hypothetical protein